MRRIPEDKLYKGNIYKCITNWSIASSYFGIAYKDELVCKGKIFVQLKDGTYAEIEDFKINKNKSTRYKTSTNMAGEYFVKDLVPLIQEKENDLTLI